jgi:hypothetical protein
MRSSRLAIDGRENDTRILLNSLARYESARERLMRLQEAAADGVSPQVQQALLMNEDALRSIRLKLQGAGHRSTLVAAPAL